MVKKRHSAASVPKAAKHPKASSCGVEGLITSTDIGSDVSTSPGTSGEGFANTMSLRLQKEMQFDVETADIFSRCGIAKSLFTLKEQGFQISEEDPLLLVGVDPNTAAARDYFDSGNYGLPAASPGHLPWPGGAAVVAAAAVAMPAGVAAGRPYAFGRFLASFPNVVDLSDGLMNAFSVSNPEVLYDLGLAVQQTVQFRRLGPTMAGMLPGRVAEDGLLRIVTLDSFRGPPRRHRGFNRTV